MRIRMGNGLLIVENEPPPEPIAKEVEHAALTESELNRGRRLLEAFRTFPEESQVEIFAQMKQLFLRRSGGICSPRNQYAQCMADVFYLNGHEQEEYT